MELLRKLVPHFQILFRVAAPRGRIFYVDATVFFDIVPGRTIQGRKEPGARPVQPDAEVPLDIGPGDRLIIGSAKVRPRRFLAGVGKGDGLGEHVPQHVYVVLPALPAVGKKPRPLIIEKRNPVEIMRNLLGNAQ